MTHTSRRTFLKGLGTTLASIGVVAGSAVVGAQPTGPAGTALALLDVSDQLERTNQVDDSQQHVAMLVVEQLHEWVASERSFTAYDVTRALRMQYPRLCIMHGDVRTVVHSRMRGLVDRQFYWQQRIRFPNGDALQYVPV
jgi:hypothetical protein